MEGHGHEEEHVEVMINSPVVDSHLHDPGFSWDELREVMFGLEHVASEFFWNAVFIAATFLFTKAVALRKIHKYVDDKHGIEHDKY
jgi:hypothetical protein